RKVVERGAQAHKEWQAQYDEWTQRAPEGKKLLDRLIGRDLPAGWADVLPTWEPDPKGVATRKASAAV
ncbi:transketolase, partial [Rhodococcus opacus M213]